MVNLILAFILGVIFGPVALKGVKWIKSKL